jgi:uncharacterized LabA/DUF88 family protein
LSKNVALFVDVANLYYSARGQDVDVDYVALLKHATKGRDLIRAYAYSGLDPDNENQRKFIDFLSKNGYKVVHKDIRKFGDGRMKANLDIELVVDLFRLAHRMDIAVIVSGDGDFAPAIRALQEGGVRCEVISFRPNTSSDLIAVADEFTDIMKIASIERAKESRGMSTPEMPAKEVNPEFGFREASAGVAAAALAAIRGGGEKPGDGRPRRSRTSRAKAAEEPATEPAVEATVIAESDNASLDGEGSRRRRRRRGGRGRGRGRRGEGTTTAGEPVGSASADGGEEEIGWQEFDDLSQLGELTDLGEVGDEREYAFTDADPATLAELGLAPAPAAEPTEGAAPARRARGRRSKVAEPASGSDVPEGEMPAAAVAAPEKPSAPRRRRTTRAPAISQDATAESADAPEAAKPARRTARRAGGTRSTASRSKTSRSSASSEAQPPAGDEAPAEAATGAPRATATRKAPARRSSRAGAAAEQPQGQETGDGSEPEGIWQRFRSGRQTKGAG